MLPKKWKKRISDLLVPANDMRPFETPLFPLTTVFFPGGVLPLKVFEQRYMDMVKRCLQDESPFGVCLIKEGAEVGAAVPHTIGSLARIGSWDMPQLGVLNLRALGAQRFQVLDYKTQEDGLLLAQAIKLPIEPVMPLPPEHAACASVLKHIVDHVGREKFEPPFDFDDGVWVGYRLAEIMPIKATAKQDMLEMNDTLIRLDVLHKFLAQQGLAT